MRARVVRVRVARVPMVRVVGVVRLVEGLGLSGQRVRVRIRVVSVRVVRAKG